MTTPVVADQAGSTTYAYDQNDGLTSESRAQNGITKTASYDYYANGLLKTQTTFEGKTITYRYDAVEAEAQG